MSLVSSLISIGCLQHNPKKLTRDFSERRYSGRPLIKLRSNQPLRTCCNDDVSGLVSYSPPRLLPYYIIFLSIQILVSKQATCRRSPDGHYYSFFDYWYYHHKKVSNFKFRACKYTLFCEQNVFYLHRTMFHFQN